ncbi:MAG: hypothetical protein ABUS79_00730 [Pseudomonadota bacterium]
MTLVSGVADAQGFIHAARIWQDGKLVWSELGKSAIGFVAGIGMYWLSLRYMKALGVVTPEVQTLIWFGVTLVGVAIISGRAFKWPLLDQGVAVAVLVGIGWLIFRTNG